MNNNNNNNNKKRRNRNRTRKGNGVKATYKVEESKRGGLSLEKLRTDYKRRLKTTRKEAGAHPACSHEKHSGLSNAVVRWLSSMAEPTLEIPYIAPIPVALPLPGPVSMERFMVRGTFFCGTQNFGYISFEPGLKGPFNNNLVVSSTLSNYTFNTLQKVALGAIQGTPYATTPYVASAALTREEFEYRCTGAVLRIRNITRTLIRDGQIVVIETPAHMYEGLIDKTYAQVANISSASVFSAVDTQGWVELTWHPSVGDDVALDGLSGLTFSDADASLANEPAVPHFSELTAVVSASAGSVFEYECYGVYELRGTQVLGKRDYPRDSEGFGVSATAINDVKAKSGAREHGKVSLTKKIHTYLDAASEAVEAIVPVAQNVYHMLF